MSSYVCKYIPPGVKVNNPLHGLKEPLLSLTVYFWTANSFRFLFIGFYHKEIVGKVCVKAIYSLTYTPTQNKTHAVRLSVGLPDSQRDQKKEKSHLEGNLKQMHGSGKIPLDKPLWCETLSLVMSWQHTAFIKHRFHLWQIWKGISEMHRRLRLTQAPDPLVRAIHSV